MPKEVGASFHVVAAGLPRFGQHVAIIDMLQHKIAIINQMAAAIRDVRS